MTIYAVAYAVSSPFLTVFSGRLQRRSVVLLGLGLVFIGALFSAVAPTTGALYASRVLVAFGAALYTPTAALIAMTISDPARRMRGLSLVVGGLTGAQILGVPLGTFIGGAFGWRWGMVVTLPITAVAAVMIARLVPRDISFHAPTFATFANALRDWRLGLVIAVMAVMGSGQYMVSAYISPIVSQAMGADADVLSIILIIFGVAALAGNLVGGAMGDRLGPVRTLLILLSVTAVTCLLFPLMTGSLFMTALVMALWGFSCFACMPPQQARVVMLSPAAGGVALSLNATAIYVSTAVGAALGGAVIAWHGTTALPMAAIGFIIAGIALLLFSDRVLCRTAAAK